MVIWDHRHNHNHNHNHSHNHVTMTMNMKLWCSTVRFVRMFYKVWTWLLQNLGFEKVKISFYCRTQWKVARPRLRSERRATHHLAWSSSASMKMESAAPQIPPANIRNEEIQETVITNWYWEGSRHPIETRCWWSLDIKKHTRTGLKRYLWRPQMSQKVL